MTDETTLAIQELTEAVEQHNEQMRLQNAVLATFVMNHENQYRKRRRDEPPTNYSYTWRGFAGDLQDALHTFEEDIER